jgi:hypothetical protein
MKISDLPGQSVWLGEGTPVLFDTASEAPEPVGHYLIVEIERVTEPADGTPALAIWRDGDRERGVAAEGVLHHVMSLPPSGDAWIIRAGNAVGEKLGAISRKR